MRLSPPTRPLLLALLLFTAYPAYAQQAGLDPSFGTDGQAILHLSGSDEAHDLLLHEDGRLTVLGTAENACGIARLERDGTLDATFGTGGIAVVEWVGTRKCSAARGGVLLGDGRIVVAGDGPGQDIVLLRLAEDGTLDTSFGTDGLVTTDVTGEDEIAYDIAQQPDGKLVVVGSLGLDGGRVATDGIVVARYEQDGTLDASFGAGGTVTVEEPASAHAVALQADGKIVVAGERGMNLAAWRFTPEGALDPSFGAEGVVELDDTRSGTDVAVLSSGAVVVAGTAGSDVRPQAALFRLQEDGALDPDFGVAGVAAAPLAYGVRSYGRGLAVDANGQAVLVGQAHITSAESDFFAARVDADGQPDAGFGEGGVHLTDLGHDYREWASAAVIQPDGQVVAAGQTAGDGWDFAVVRYEAGTATAAERDVVPAALTVTHAPSPVRHGTTIRYELPTAAAVRLQVYDLLGRSVATLVDAQQAAGAQQVRLDAASLPAGIYLCRLQAGRRHATTRLVVVR